MIPDILDNLKIRYYCDRNPIPVDLVIVGPVCGNRSFNLYQKFINRPVSGKILFFEEAGRFNEQLLVPQKSPEKFIKQIFRRQGYADQTLSLGLGTSGLFLDKWILNFIDQYPDNKR